MFLHRYWSDKSTEWLWTDLLCIDQAYHSELNEQIARMGEIYSRAEHVISWLGECPRGVAALDTMAFLDENSQHRISEMLGAAAIRIRDALQRLLQDEIYWRRIWVLQEVVCAK